MSHSPEPLLLETIAIRDGVPKRLELHQQRVDRSRQELLKASDRLLLADHITVPKDLQQGLVKCRVLYDTRIHLVEFVQYIPRPIEGTAVAALDNYDYSHKYANRAVFTSLEEQALNRAVIVSQHGFVTDATYANLALYDGERWITPTHYLLNGIMRQWLLKRGMIEERTVHVEDLPSYRSMKLVNAMMEFEESPIIPLNDILYL